MSFTVFTRTWWTRDPALPAGRICRPGRKYTLADRVATEAEALEICRRYNDSHDPGPLSRRAEYDEN